MMGDCALRYHAFPASIYLSLGINFMDDFVLQQSALVSVFRPKSDLPFHFPIRLISIRSIVVLYLQRRRAWRPKHSTHHMSTTPASPRSQRISSRPWAPQPSKRRKRHTVSHPRASSTFPNRSHSLFTPQHLQKLLAFSPSNRSVLLFPIHYLT